MKYAVIYSSPTGNTQMLAQAIQDTVQGECCYFGKPDTLLPTVDVLFVGFWTDKGTCDESIQNFLQSLEHQNIFLFGTAGYGGSQDYFEGILSRVKTHINDTNHIVGSFMCQGKMPLGIRKRYETLAQSQPETFLPMIENFDKALSHPSQDDLATLKEHLLHIKVKA